MIEVVSHGHVFQLPEPGSENRSVFAFSTNRAGSTLLNSILGELAGHAGLTFYNISREAVEKGIRVESLESDCSKLIQEKGYIYGGFRMMPPFPLPDLSTYRPVLLMRDPRDIVCSLYFSRRLSHGRPGGGGSALANFNRNRAAARVMGIDEFAHSIAPSRRRKIETLDPVRTLSRVYRYEDVIFRKAEWIRDMANHYGWHIGDAIADQVAAEHDVFPESERQDQHVRKVRPGDHREKLAPETIEYLNREFAGIMKAYGYQA